jgi:hypothetical protein
VKIRKKNALEEAEEPEPEPTARTMTVWNLAEWPGLTEASIRVFEDNRMERAVSSSKWPGKCEDAGLL